VAAVDAEASEVNHVACDDIPDRVQGAQPQ
jgi:hypothetical protein